jgi:micrococcal nuclease
LCGLLFSVRKVSADIWYKVSWVEDGDSIVLQDGRHVRYIGINSPEIQHKDRKAEPFGYKAKSINKKLVFDKEVRLEFDREKKDHYGRTLAYVYLRNDLFLNAEMVSQGAAYFLYIRPNTKYTAIFIKHQQDAMQAGRGLWQKWSESKAEYIGNKRSRRFHLPTCPFTRKIKSANKVRFSKKWDAFRAGYAPAKRCLAEWWPQ